MLEVTKRFETDEQKARGISYGNRRPLHNVTQLLPGSAGVHHPQVGVRRSDGLERHPKVPLLAPSVSPTVLKKRQPLCQIVAQTEHFMSALLLSARFWNRHNTSVGKLL